MKNELNINGQIVKNVSLAPMAGVADKAYRLICKKHKLGFSTSEMISAKAVTYGDGKTFDLASITKEEQPISLQLFGHEPDCIGKATDILLNTLIKDGTTPFSIDLNMGCPVPKIVKNGDGSALMKNPSLASEIIKETVKAASGIPVSVKMRLGWDANSINVVDFAKMAEDSGATFITIHARTRTQLYSPGVDWSYIKKAKDNVSIPVFGNGDVFTGEDAKRLLNETGCDGVAVARGSLGNPWIFDEIDAVLNDKEFIPPTKEEKINEAIEYLEMMIETKGERNGLIESRKVISAFTKGMYGSPTVRNSLNLANTKIEVIDLLQSLLK